MKQLFALVMMQLRDKITFSGAKDKKSLIIKVVLSLVKFIAVTAVCFLLCFISRQLLGLFYADETPSVMTLVLTIFFFLSLISCTAGLVKTMYFADDNKVLVTFPLGENIVFISKLLVFYVYEIIKGMTLLVPIILGFVLSMVTINLASPVAFIEIWIPVLIYTALPVLLGAILSIPTLFIVRLIKRYKAIGYVLFILIVSAVVYGVVSLISIIPENLNLMTLYSTVIAPAIRTFLREFSRRFGLFANIVSIFIGEKTPKGLYAYNWLTLLKFVILIAINALLFLIVFLTTKNLFYLMMRKNFEFNKERSENQRKNKAHSVWFTFIVKEIRLTIRSSGTVLSFLSVYIVVPIMVFLMNKIFAAINTSVVGDNMSYAFNLLIMTLPLLASNSLIASVFSKEGRAGYIKKTKPIKIYFALIAKLLLYIVSSAISILVTVIVFSSFNNFGFAHTILLFLGIYLLNLGHMFWSASMDLMKPMNESYATTGEAISNPNENISTIVAFLLSAIFAFFSYILFGESIKFTNSLTQAFLKLALIGLLVFASAFSMFMLKVKAFYYDR